MKKLLLLIALIIAGVYGYHWFNGDPGFGGNPPAATPAPATPEMRRATPKPTPSSVHSLEVNRLQTNGLNPGAHGPATPPARKTTQASSRHL